MGERAPRLAAGEDLRTISALLEREEAQDALIDAVIALENLFGSANATGEVVFRVTTAAAHLLEPDPAKRTAKRKKLSKIYDARSKVIHGVTITKRMKLPERKEEAIEAAVGSLRAFCAERPHLIADRDRGLRLILGTAGENRG
jgi:Apea-like HEPN